MNRRIRKELKVIREACWNVDNILGEEEPTEEEPELESAPEIVNWSSADEPSKDTVYLKDLKELTELKGITITGQITSAFDLKSYIKKDTGSAGIIYRFVLSDETGGVTAITFDEMAGKLKEYPIGTYLRITNAWKMKKNKHNIPELHLGNFAKIEVVE